MNFQTVRMPANLQKYIFVVILVLSFSLSIENISDDDQENKTYPIIVLVIDILITLGIIYSFVKK